MGFNESEVSKYRPEFITIRNTVSDFVETKHIDPEKLNVFDNVLKWTVEDKFEVLNNAYLTIKEQMILFGAFTEIEKTIKVLKEKLEMAIQRHENPTTAVQVLDLMPSLIEIGPLVDVFINTKKISNFDSLHMLTRKLYKDARASGFSKDTSSQIDDIGISNEEVNSVVTSFIEVLSLEEKTSQ